MITQASKLLRSVSTAECYRVVDTQSGPVIVNGTPGSVTLSKNTITEIPTEAFEETPTPETIKTMIAGMVLESELTEEELQMILFVYEDYEVNRLYPKDALFKYAGKLYKVNQAHTSAIQWVPGVGTESLYSVVAPAGVIPVWAGPFGGPYNVGSLVQWPEGGIIWRSTIPANTTEPGTLLPWGYWVEYVEN